MDLGSLLRNGQGRLAIGIAVGVLAAVTAVGVVAGHSGSSQTAGATGTSGPTGANHARKKVHRHHHHAPQKPEEVPVPNVVGESEEAATAQLAAHDLRGHFAEPAALACAEAAPGARVIGQVPESGGRARAGERVALFPSAYVQKGCGQPTAPRACDPAELSVSVGESKPDYTGGGDDSLAVARISHVRGQSECAVNSALTVSINQSDGEPLSRIAGNPMMLQMHASLDIGEKMISEWLLGAWCGSRKGAVLTASFAGLAASQSLKELPYGDACPTISLYSLVKANARQG